MAEAIKPANVIPICMVDKNSVGLAKIRTNCCAFLCPSSAMILILVSLRVIKAISEAAKKALVAISAMRIRA